MRQRNQRHHFYYWASACKVLLILLFSYAALSKLLELPEFRGQLHNQNLTPALADSLVWLIPCSELLACGLLLSAPTRWYGLVLSLWLMILFTGYIALVLLHFWPRIPCSCGGVIGRLSWGAHLWFNVFFLLTALLGLSTTPRVPDRQ